MNRIYSAFGKLRPEGRAAFIPFLTAGDPDFETTLGLILEAERAGSDIIELGFPFSDPVADGPVIQASYTRALAGGQYTSDVFELVNSVRQESQIPIVAMISYSLVFKMGFNAFLERALEVGLDGATIPDLPMEEAEQYYPQAEQNAFPLVCFITPASAPERREKAIQNARGFIYYVSVKGITGTRDKLPADLAKNVGELRQQTSVPVAVGFGISTPAQARAVAEIADGVIVGSAIVDSISEATQKGDDPVEAATQMIAELARATKAGPKSKG